MDCKKAKKWYNTKKMKRNEKMKLIASSSYLPNKIVMNKELSEKLGVTEEFIEKRISALNGKMGIIYSYGLTELERIDKKLRIEDALSATKAAVPAPAALSIFSVNSAPEAYILPSPFKISLEH